MVLKNGEYFWSEIKFSKGLTSFRFGLEAEFVMGFNNNKWAFLLEPTYQQFESEGNSSCLESAPVIQSHHFLHLLLSWVEFDSSITDAP